MTLSDLLKLALLAGPVGWAIALYLICFFIAGFGALALVVAAWVVEARARYWRVLP